VNELNRWDATTTERKNYVRIQRVVQALITFAREEEIKGSAIFRTPLQGSAAAVPCVTFS
jgi:hypothetical protein